MTDTIGPASVTNPSYPDGAPLLSDDPNRVLRSSEIIGANYSTSELAQFSEAAVLDASKHTWPMSARLDPKTFQRMAEMAGDTDVLSINGNAHVIE